MKRNRLHVAFTLAVVLSPSLIAAPIPALDLPRLVSEADLIVVGRAGAALGSRRTTIQASGREAAATAISVQLHVARVIKGEVSGSTIVFEYFVPDEPLLYGAIQADQVGVFFLALDPSGGFQVLDAHYPYVAASLNPVSSNGEALERVIAEVAGVLRAPGETAENRRTAISVLASVDNDLTTAALREAFRGQPAPLRFDAAAALLSRGDLLALKEVEEILLDPDENMDRSLLLSLASAIEVGVRDAGAVPSLGRLVQSTSPDVRRRAAAALIRMGRPTVDLLAKALYDDDRLVRYYAVIGLARITGRGEMGPAIDRFNEDEQRYLDYWGAWAKSKR